MHPFIKGSALCLVVLTLSACDSTNREVSAVSESLAPLPSDQTLVRETHRPSGEPAASADDPATPSDPAHDECGAEKLGEYLNRIPTMVVMDDVHDAIGHDRIRTIRPGDAVTMDYRPDRLNIELGEDGRIELFRCG